MGHDAGTPEQLGQGRLTLPSRPPRTGPGSRGRACRPRPARRSRRPASPGAPCPATTPPAGRGHGWRAPRGGARAVDSGRSQPGRLMKSETTTTIDLRRMVATPWPSSVERSVASRSRQPGCVEQGTRDAQHLVAPDPRGDGRSHPVPVQHRAHPVAMPLEDARQRGHEVDDDRALLPPVAHGPEVHRRRQVDQEPAGDLAVLVVQPDVRHLHARRDVPVDVADVVHAAGTRAGRRGPRRGPGTGSGSRPGAVPSRRRTTCQSRRWRTRSGADADVAMAMQGNHRDRDATDDGAQQVVGRDVVGECLVGQHQPVPQHVERHVQHVLGQRVVPAADEGERLRGQDQVDGRTWARAEGDVAPDLADAVLLGRPRRAHHAHRVLDERRVDVHRVHLSLEVSERLGGEHRLGRWRRPDLALDDDELLVGGGIAHDDLEHEPVDLGLRQLVGPLALDGVLGRQHEERVGHPMRVAARWSPGAPASPPAARSGPWLARG